MECKCGSRMKVVRTVTTPAASFRYYRCLKCGREVNTEEKTTPKAKEKMNAARNNKYKNDKKVLQNDIK